MQLKKSSNKTKKTTDKAPVAAAPEKSVAAAEVKPNPRTLKSSTTKKSSEDAITASPSHHHKLSSAPLPDVRVAEEKPVKPAPAPKTAAATESVKPATARTVTQEDIAALAHSYWVARSHAHGFSHEDWVRAEQELLNQR